MGTAMEHAIASKSVIDHNLPKMSFADRMVRSEEKRSRILNFLASGECWTTQEVVQSLLGCSQSSALRTLQGLERDRLIRRELFSSPYAQKKFFTPPTFALWGITEAGIYHAPDFFKGAPSFQISKVNPDRANIHVMAQHARLRAEAAGWHDWVSQKVWRGTHSKQISEYENLGIEIFKVRRKFVNPDAVALRRDGLRAGIYFEYDITSANKMAILMQEYLVHIVNRNSLLDIVVFINSNPRSIYSALERVEYVKIDGSRIIVSPAHRSRFQVFSSNDFPKAFKAS